MGKQTDGEQTSRATLTDSSHQAITSHLEHQSEIVEATLPKSPWSGYWRKTFLDKILPDVIKNVLTALLIWLGALAAGYGRNPSAVVLAVLVGVAGIGALVVGTAIALLPATRFEPKLGGILRLAFTTLGIAVLATALLYTAHHPERRNAHEFELEIALLPVIVAFVISEVYSRVARHRQQSAHQTKRRRELIRSIGVIVMIVGTIAWLTASQLSWTKASPLPAAVPLLLGALYLIAFRASAHKAWIWPLVAVAVHAWVTRPRPDRRDGRRRVGPTTATLA